MAATPTRDESATQIKDAVKLVEAALDGVATLPANEQTLIANLESDFATAQAAGAAAFRGAVARALSQSGLALTPALIAFVKHQVGTPERDVQTVISRLYQDLIDNTETILGRNMTLSAPAAGGSNVGTGTVLRLTVDENNYDLEATHLDTKTLVCVTDANGGATKHEELWRIRGATANVDAIEPAGSGRARSDEFTRSTTSRDSELTNAGFEQYALGSASFTADVAALTSDSTVTGWDLLNAAGSASDPTLYELDQTAAAQYRTLVGVTSPTSIRMTANAVLSQDLATNSVALNFAQPYSTVIHVKPENSADGTITVAVGGTTIATQSVAGLSAGAWNKITVATQNSWPSNFNANDAALTITWSGRTTGDLVFDEIEALVPMWRFDGGWYQISGGQTPWLADDTYTCATALVGSDSEFQKWMWRTYGRHLPHSQTPTARWAEPF